MTVIDDLPAPSAYARILLGAQPRAAPALLAGTGLDPAQLAARPSLTVAQELQVFRNAMRLVGRSEWAIDFGRMLNISSHGPLGFAALSAPTLGEGLDVLAQFGCIRAPYLEFRRRHDANRYVLELDYEAYPLGDLGEPMLDIVFQVCRAFVDAILGEGAAQPSLWLRRQPPGRRRVWESRIGMSCEYRCPVDAFCLPLSLCALPNPLHDESTYRAALVKCREALGALLAPNDVRTRAANWLAARFDEMVSVQPGAALPQLDELARALAMTPRTLTRRLAAQGTGFRALRDTEQHAAACRLLADARHTVADVGVRLGYGDAANFGRAFRRIAGESPGRYRRG